MIEATKGVGTQVLKFRGGMPLLGMTRVFGMYRLANSMALLDAKIRGVGPDKAARGRGFDNYSWHTDLPPGHPMVTGQQTVEFDLHAVEHGKTVVVWGMNWITTKMPDAHWLTEARLKGTRIVVIACEYCATASKGDEVLVVRPGTTPALALGLCERHPARETVRRRLRAAAGPTCRCWCAWTRSSTCAPPTFSAASRRRSTNQTQVMGASEKDAAARASTRDMLIPEALRKEWGDYVWWDRTANAPKPLTRDQVGEHSQVGDPLLEGRDRGDAGGRQEGPLPSGLRPGARSTPRTSIPKTTEEITWAPAAAVETLARHLATEPGTTLFAVGMGPNQFFNNDNKDRDDRSCWPR